MCYTRVRYMYLTFYGTDPLLTVYTLNGLPSPLLAASIYLHLSAVHVKKGDRVKKGQVVAALGATGRATGPHLDWRVNWFQTRLDPQLLVGPAPPALK